VRRHCRKLHERALPRLLTRVRKLGFSDQDLNNGLKWIRESAPTIVHINLEKYAGLLSKDTHYRSQFETFTSGGTLDQRKRTSWEHRLFGGAYAKACAFERVKYGALNVVNDPGGVRACRQYGSSYLLLRHARLRCTFSATDSATLSIDDLATVDYHAHVLERYTDEELTQVLRVGNRHTLGMDSHVLRTYKEAQIHGEVRLDEHIELIMAHPSCRTAASISPAVMQALQALALRCRTQVVWIERGFDATNHLPTLPVARSEGEGPAAASDAAGGSVDAAIRASLAGVAADEGPLPAGWCSALDPTSGHTYYYVLGSQESQWERPTAAAPAPPVWEVETAQGWQPFTGEALRAIAIAAAAGQPTVVYQARGYHYEVDIVNGVQHNLATGKSRPVRRLSTEGLLVSEIEGQVTEAWDVWQHRSFIETGL